MSQLLWSLSSPKKRGKDGHRKGTIGKSPFSSRSASIGGHLTGLEGSVKGLASSPSEMVVVPSTILRDRVLLKEEEKTGKENKGQGDGDVKSSFNPS